MLAEWSVECNAEDPVLVVPWHDPEGSATFVDLRANPYDLDDIPEAEEHPPLMHALRALNAQRSPVFTAKCDAWPLDSEQITQLHLELDVPPADASAGFASYIDLVWRERSVFTSFHQQEQMVQRLVRNAIAIDCPLAALDCALRPAFVDLGAPREGYAVSLYVKALGADTQSAWGNWAVALEAVVALLRGKDLASAMGNKARAS
jgi:hypothetical protein